MSSSTSSSEAEYRRFVLWTVGVCLAVFAVHVVAFELYARLYVVPRNGIEVKKRRMVAAEDRVRVLLLGDSHAGEVIFPGKGEEFFNWANGSDTPPILYFKAKFTFRNAPGLRVILLQADYHQFSHLSTLYNHMRQYKEFIDEPVDRELGYYPMRGERRVLLYSMEENYGPALYRTIWRDVKRVARGMRPKAVSDGVEADGDWGGKSERERRIHAEYRLKAHIYSKYLVNRKSVGYYERIIKEAKRRGIRVYLVRFPLSDEYLEGIDRKTEGEIEGLYEGISKRYGVKILDYRRMFAGRTERFSNSDHMSEVGGRMLGERLAEEAGEGDEEMNR